MLDKKSNLKWKDIYNNNKQRKYCEITGIKEENVELESNSYKSFKNNKYYVIAISIIITLVLLYTFRNDLKVFGIVMLFLAVMGVGFYIFNYFKFKCVKEGLYIKFGIQQALFSYDKIKSIYLSKFNDYSFLIPSRGYSIVVRYADNNERIKELAFPNHFLNKEETEKFLNNFTIQESENKSYVNYERFKTFKMVAKTVGIVLFAIIILYFLILNK